MPRPEKVLAVQDIKARITASQAAFLTEYRGLTVTQLQRLRRGLRQAGAEYKVVKMTLARRAAAELGLTELTDALSGPVGLAFVSGDPAAVAKALRDFSRENDRLVVKGGLLSGSMLGPEQVSRLADLEPKEVLLARAAGTVRAPLTKLAGLVVGLPRNAASLFSQLVEKKEMGTAA